MPPSSPVRLAPLCLVLGYGLVAALPVLLAWAQGLEPRPWRDEIASGLALAAFAMLCMEFFLSGRYKALSARVGPGGTRRSPRAWGWTGD